LLTFFVAGNWDHSASDVVDIFDAKAATWHTAKLSVAHDHVSATSLPSQGLALFAGGSDGA
jgi:hypothetical protein